MGEKVEHVLGHGDHGSTFGGNPVACAGAVSIINRLDDAFLAEVQRKGNILFSALEGAPGIEKITGMGMMCGVKPVKRCALPDGQGQGPPAAGAEYAGRGSGEGSEYH